MNQGEEKTGTIACAGLLSSLYTDKPCKAVREFLGIFQTNPTQFLTLEAPTDPSSKKASSCIVPPGKQTKESIVELQI